MSLCHNHCHNGQSGLKHRHSVLWASLEHLQQPRNNSNVIETSSSDGRIQSAYVNHYINHILSSYTGRQSGIEVEGFYGSC